MFGNESRNVSMIDMNAYSKLFHGTILYVSAQFAKTEQMFVESVPKLFGLVAVIWSFSLYDVLGREVGDVQALWILALTVVLPWFLRIGVFEIRKYSCAKVVKQSENGIVKCDSIDAKESGDVEFMVINPLRRG